MRLYSGTTVRDKTPVLANAAPRSHITHMDEPKPIAAPKQAPKPDAPPQKPPREIGGPPGPEPTRYGDWAINGRCTDF